MQTVFHIHTSDPGLQEFADDVERFVRVSGLQEFLRRVVGHLET